MKITLLLLFLFSAQAQDTVRLTLDNSIEIALKKSPFAARNAAERNQVQASVWSSLGGALPNLSLVTGFDRNGPEVDFDFGIPLVPPTLGPVFSNNEYSTSFSVSQNLLALPEWWRIRQALQASRNASATYTGSQADLAFDVIQRYLELVRQRVNLGTARASVRQNEEQARVTRAQFELGSIARPELLRIEVALSRSRIELLDARTAVEDAQRTLANLLGIPGPIAVDTMLAFPDTSVFHPGFDSLLAQVLDTNPSIAAAAYGLRASLTGRQAIWLEKIPSISGSFTYGTTAPELDELFGNWSRGDYWVLSLRLTWSILEGLGWYGRLRDADARVSAADAGLRISRNSAIEQLREAWSDLQTTREGLALIGDLTEGAQLQYELTMQKYRLGAASALDLLTSQLDYVESKRQSNDVIVDYYLAEAEINRLLGVWRGPMGLERRSGP